MTPAEKASIEAADAKWVEPSEELKATAKAAGVYYNVKTGYFEYNTLVDITTEQLRTILFFSTPDLSSYTRDTAPFRTLIYNKNGYFGERCLNAPTRNNRILICSSCQYLEVIRISEDRHPLMPPSDETIFQNCGKLHTILGVLNAERVTSGTWQLYLYCASLANFKVKNLKTHLSIQSAKEASLESISYLVDNAANTTPITITLHPDAHARLTDELIAQAAEKQITFATT